VPGPAVTSRGPVASVAIYTRVEPRDIRSIAMDTSSRTSVALSTVLLRRVYGVRPEAVPMAPDLDAMLARADAALIIGDLALFLDHTKARLKPDTTDLPATDLRAADTSAVLKIDLGALWTETTGLPFVYAVWAGWTGTIRPDDARALRRARDEGVAASDEVAHAYYPDDPGREAVARRYLRDNIQYVLGDEELDGLRTFYRYAAEEGLVAGAGELRFF
jgi:chorismate dehydratase